ncbi:hypothetical protein DPMN_186416 [Dreissena polymorpha]|uniref:Uncharacterized protein n=1 Tax=Dreissena polymorpha TaxID=45954 RepID=A0A9D4I861_DREPO|nr:hypothetical protein DPMN_186416 [Dreissena polymorpha]
MKKNHWSWKQDMKRQDMQRQQQEKQLHELRMKVITEAAEQERQLFTLKKSC